MVRRSLLVLSVVVLVLALAGCRVIEPKVVSVTIDQSDVTLAVGRSAALSVTVDVVGGASRAVLWSSDDEGVAAVKDEGVLTGIAVGEALISVASEVDPSKVDQVVVTVVAFEGVLLDGDADDLASDAVVSIDVVVPVAEEWVEADESLLEPSLVGLDGAEPPRVARNMVEIAFTDDATVGEVNAVLEAVGGRIVSAVDGIPIVVVRLPDPGDLDGLHAAIASIESEATVEFVLPQFVIPRPDRVDEASVSRRALPEGIDPSEPFNKPPDARPWRHLSAVSHHLALRAHATWNLRSAVSGSVVDAPRLVIADFFGSGPPVDGFDIHVPTPADFEVGAPNSHGYHVLGIVAGAWAPESGLDDERSQVTGIFPATTVVRAVDISIPEGNLTLGVTENRILEQVRALREEDSNRVVIVNTSIGFINGMQAAIAENLGRSWLTKVRGWGANRFEVGAGLEHAFLHISAAGNVGDILWCSDCPAERASQFNAAALFDLRTPGLLRLPNLTNTLVVGNVLDTYPLLTDAPTDRPKPHCLSAGSLFGGNVAAIGEDVRSFTATGTDLFSGTSMAAPQVAGLALFLASLDPTLSVPQLMSLITETTSGAVVDSTSEPSSRCRGEASPPVVDALDAVLRAGGTSARRTLLDVDGDGRFDEDDLEVFVNEWTTREGALDFSRYDLNGSGRSGGDSQERFDLTMNGRYANVQITFEAVLDGQPETVTVGMHEQSVTDLGILCFYAYDDATGLYLGDALARRELIANACLTGDLGGEPGGPTGDLFDDFDDRDYTVNPSWTHFIAGNKDLDPARNYVDVSNQYARWVSSNHGGRGGSVGLEIEVDIPVNAGTVLQFDALATFRDVGAGCGWTCREYPANVALHLEDAAGGTYRVIYAVNYGGALEDQSGADFRFITTPVTQGVWERGLRFNVRDGWPSAARVTMIRVYGSGWNFDGGIDNIALPAR